MVARVKCTVLVSIFTALWSTADLSSTEVYTGGKVDVQVECGELIMRITVKRQFFEDRHVPFQPEYLRLGLNATQLSSCGPVSPVAAAQMVISARMHECGTESSVRGEWLVYSNQLVLSPAVAVTSEGSVAVRRATTLIPVECLYKRKQTVSGEPLIPTWLPMTSTVRAFGLLRFSLLIMADDCSSPRSSSMYHQGEALFLEAAVEAPLHTPLILHVSYCIATQEPDPQSYPRYKFIMKHGCLMDSILPGSSSKFLPRKENTKLCFSVQALRFNQSGEQMFISCHLTATLKQKSHSSINKACYFHRPTFRWRSTEGDDSSCECCEYDDCSGLTKEETSGIAGHSRQPHIDRIHESQTTVGPVHILPRSHWTGYLSVGH